MAFGFTYTLPTITGSHTDFPVTLRTADFPTASLNGANEFLNGGGNLRAYTNDTKTTQLAVDIESLVTGASAEALVHIKVPTAATGNTIYIEADDVATTQPAVTDTFGRNAVWSDYEAVYHLGEAVNNTAGGYVNSVGSADATGTSMALTEVAAQLGDGQDFDGTSDFISIPDGVMAAVESANRLTVSTWVKMDSTASDGTLSGLWVSGSNGRQYLLYMDADGAGPNYRFGVGSSDDASTFTSTDSGGATTGSWQKVTGTWDGTNVRVYLDGTQNSSNSGARTITSSTIDVGVGSDRGDLANRQLDGKIDELRIRAEAVSANWEATEYDNQSSVGAWGTVGSWAEAGGDVNVSATTDALVITEQSATVNAETNVSATTDALVITGQVATVTLPSNNTNVAATTDALTLSTLQATVNAATNVAATSGSLTLTGFTSTITSDVPPKIDGASNVLITANGGEVSMYFNGTDYFVV